MSQCLNGNLVLQIMSERVNVWIDLVFLGDKHELSFVGIQFKHIGSCPSFDVTYTFLHREVAWIFSQEEQTSKIVCHQQMDRV